LAQDTNGSNVFDIDILSQRLRYLVEMTKKHLKAEGFTHLFVLFMGDLLNSSRRLDERVRMATSLTNASLLVADLMKSILIDLAQDFDIYTTMVVGNESRIPDEMHNTDILLTESFDYVSYRTAEILLQDTPIKFLKANIREHILHLKDAESGNEFNFLLLHGDALKGKKTPNAIVKEMVAHYAMKGVIVKSIIIGHYHHYIGGDTLFKTVRYAVVTPTLTWVCTLQHPPARLLCF
jgi:hypothetical protein